MKNLQREGALDFHIAPAVAKPELAVLTVKMPSVEGGGVFIFLRKPCLLY